MCRRLAVLPLNQFAVNLNSCQRRRNIFHQTSQNRHRKSGTQRPETGEPLWSSTHVYSVCSCFFCCCVCIVVTILARVLSIVSVVCHVSRARECVHIKCWAIYYRAHTHTHTFYLSRVKANLGALYPSTSANEIETTYTHSSTHYKWPCVSCSRVDALSSAQGCSTCRIIIAIFARPLQTCVPGIFANANKIHADCRLDKDRRKSTTKKRVAQLK